MGNNDNQPIVILPEDSKRTKGRDAQGMNILAAKLVAETVRTTLGPKGMDKMLVDSMGSVIVTNDGVTILQEMDIQHPTAKMVVEIAKTQENEVGDGTTTAVVLAGQLLKQAEELLEQDIHPTVIAKGYRMASEQSMKILKSIAKPITKDDKDIITKVAITAMTGKGAEANKDILSDLIYEAMSAVGSFAIKDVKVETKVGGAVEDSELISGIVLDKEKVHPRMPSAVKDAKVALLDTSLEVKSTETDAKISITDPDKLQAFLDMEEGMLKKMVTKVKESGATVVFCQKGIDDVAQHFLAKQGIFAARRVPKSDMETLAKATGANIVNNVADLTKDDLGSSGLVEEVVTGDDAMIYVRECPGAKNVTILVRGGTEHVVDEIHRALDDALGDVASAIRNGQVVAGAGAPEIHLARELREYADTLSGREQLAVQAFAKAMEIIPRTLAENAGLDPIDVLTELRAAHEKSETAGINVFTGKIMDAWKEGVIEPLQVKTQAVSSAADVATMILRIDDVIAGGGSEEPRGPPPGMPPGMGM